MAIDAPTNAWTEVENAFALALPQSATFRTFCRGADAETAAEFVFLEELGESLTGRVWTPAALANIDHSVIVTSAAERPFRLRRVTADAFAASGQVALYFDRRIAPGDLQTQDTLRDSRNQVDREMKNLAVSIVLDLIDYWEENGGPYVTAADVVEGPLHNHPNLREDEGHWQGCEVTIDWGVQPGS